VDARQPARLDELDPLPYDAAWPSLRTAWGRVDIHTLAAFWVQESKLKGHYLEFGVGSGRSAVAAIRANTRHNPESVGRFFLFDSFAGLPALTGPDAGSTQFREGQYAFSEDQVREKLRQHGIHDQSRVSLVPGFFERSLPGFDARELRGWRAAIIHIDADLYGSAKLVLDFVTAHLQQGTVILFDDWNAFAASWSHGERAAAREWIEANPGLNLESYAKYGWHGEAFLVHRAEPGPA
jgi:hypothetical protein